jgi:hypothetical protein
MIKIGMNYSTIKQLTNATTYFKINFAAAFMFLFNSLSICGSDDLIVVGR